MTQYACLYYGVPRDDFWNSAYCVTRLVNRRGFDHEVQICHQLNAWIGCD